MLNDTFVKEYIKGAVAANNGKNTIKEIINLVIFSCQDREEIRIQIEWYLKEKVNIFSLVDSKLYFNFGKPYNIDCGRDFIGSVQNRLASKGYRWMEEIYNDGGADTRVHITRDPDCHWDYVHSSTCLTVGFGRFYRSECWLKIADWLDRGGFEND